MDNKKAKISKKKSIDRKEFIKKSLSKSALMVGGSSILLTQMGCSEDDSTTAAPDTTNDLHTLDTKVGEFSMWSTADKAVLTHGAENLEKQHLLEMTAKAHDDPTMPSSAIISSFSTSSGVNVSVDDMASIHNAMDQHAGRNVGGYTSLLEPAGSRSDSTEVSCCCSCTPCCSCATNVIKPVVK